jgi:hypothetical protein
VSTGTRHCPAYIIMGDCEGVERFPALRLCPPSVRLDVELAEVAALRGSANTIARCRPFIHSEYHQSEEAYGEDCGSVPARCLVVLARPTAGASSSTCVGAEQ